MSYFIHLPNVGKQTLDLHHISTLALCQLSTLALLKWEGRNVSRQLKLCTSLGLDEEAHEHYKQTHHDHTCQHSGQHKSVGVTGIITILQTHGWTSENEN